MTKKPSKAGPVYVVLAVIMVLKVTAGDRIQAWIMSLPPNLQRVPFFIVMVTLVLSGIGYLIYLGRQENTDA
jgi:hypothetical protein